MSTELHEMFTEAEPQTLKQTVGRFFFLMDFLSLEI